MLKGNPHIAKLIQHREETPIDKLSDEIERLRKKFGCEKVIDFSESIEVALSQHPRSPNYKLTKPERLARFNRNFYEYSFEHAGYPHQGVCGWATPNPDHNKIFRPELFFEKSEIDEARKYLKPGFNILMGMSGSGNNKAWPYSEALAIRICQDYPDVHIITVGDLKCKIIEPVIEGRVTNLSGEIPMRISMALTGLVDLVIAPDTGIIHAAGCYDTPKICLLGHNTIECITKHFTNDYSIEADSTAAPCSPCLFLVYNIKLQCPIDDSPHDQSTGAVWCMAYGIPMEQVYERFKQVYKEKV